MRRRAEAGEGQQLLPVDLPPAVAPRRCRVCRARYAGTEPVCDHERRADEELARQLAEQAPERQEPPAECQSVSGLSAEQVAWAEANGSFVGWLKGAAEAG